MLREDIKHLSENAFKGFWKITTAAADVLGVESPTLSRSRKISGLLDDRGAPSHSFQAPEALYRQGLF